MSQFVGDDTPGGKHRANALITQLESATLGPVDIAGSEKPALVFQVPVLDMAAF